ncbi:MAG: response regulator [Proteobacteria bacterium]|nr:response regulator [Pseudomonadota bacterium]
MPAQPLRLLLVDDEQGFVNVLCKRFTKRGFDVVTALSGSEAIHALREQDFDVCVLDLKMEDMDGIEVLKVLKKMSPDLPVIFLTGHGSERAAIEGLRFGATDYLMKPCDFEALQARVLKAAGRD